MLFGVVPRCVNPCVAILFVLRDMSVMRHSTVARGSWQCEILNNVCVQVTAVLLVNNCEVTDASVVQGIYDRTWCHKTAGVLRSLASNAPNITELDWSHQVPHPRTHTRPSN